MADGSRRLNEQLLELSGAIQSGQHSETWMERTDKVSAVCIQHNSTRMKKQLQNDFSGNKEIRQLALELQQLPTEDELRLYAAKVCQQQLDLHGITEQMNDLEKNAASEQPNPVNAPDRSTSQKVDLNNTDSLHSFHLTCT